jgi:hypothetical protein
MTPLMLELHLPREVRWQTAKRMTEEKWRREESWDRISAEDGLQTPRRRESCEEPLAPRRTAAPGNWEPLTPAAKGWKPVPPWPVGDVAAREADLRMEAGCQHAHGSKDIPGKLQAAKTECGSLLSLFGGEGAAEELQKTQAAFESAVGSKDTTGKLQRKKTGFEHALGPEYTAEELQETDAGFECARGSTGSIGELQKTPKTFESAFGSKDTTGELHTTKTGFESAFGSQDTAGELQKTGFQKTQTAFESAFGSKDTTGKPQRKNIGFEHGGGEMPRKTMQEDFWTKMRSIVAGELAGMRSRTAG